jgi:folate/biopterin transporter
MPTHNPDLPQVEDTVTKKLLFGNELNPELIVIITIYFVQGGLGLARLAANFFLKDQLLMTPVEMSVLLGITAIPWMIKPLFGITSDILPIFGYRRKPYLVLSGILGTLAWVSLATIVNNSVTAAIALTTSSVSVALSDVIIDSVIVERIRGESQAKLGSLQSLCWSSLAIGGLCTSYFSGLLLEYFTTKTVFLITALFPLLVSVIVWLITENPVSKDAIISNTTKQQLEQVRAAISQKAILLPTLFIFIWHATPSADSAFFYFFTNELDFNPEYLGRVQLVASIANLIGIGIFQRFLKELPFRVIFTWGIILSTTLGMTMLLLVTHTNRILGIDDHWFNLADSLVLTVIGQVAFMPVLILAARICPTGIEATFFALLMSIFNLGGLISRQLGAIIMYWLGITENNFDFLWLLVLIANLSNLLPLFFINWLPKAEAEFEFTTLADTLSDNQEDIFLN